MNGEKWYAIVRSSKLVSVWRPIPSHKHRRTQCLLALGFSFICVSLLFFHDEIFMSRFAAHFLFVVGARQERLKQIFISFGHFSKWTEVTIPVSYFTWNATFHNSKIFPIHSIHFDHRWLGMDKRFYLFWFISFFIYFQALNGFLMILTCDGEVFFATHSIESYLGFHQVSFT